MSASPARTRLDLDDIQSIVVGAHGKLPAASYLLLAVTDASLAREWVGELAGRIHTAEQGPPEGDPCVNVAFTFHGFEKLQLVEQALRGFSRELQEGMWDNPRRRRILGDEGRADPANWAWGGPNSVPVDILLMLYAKDEPGREALVANEMARLEPGGLELIDRMDSSDLGAPKEHFGFRDGVSRPRLASLTSSTDEAHVVADGEFILGYPNGYNDFTMRPFVDPIHDPDALLPDDVCDSLQRDFGRNGSYLVFRQLEQDVPGFWEFMEKQTSNAGASDEKARDRLAAKMVGRWRGGASLVKSPDGDDRELSTDNDFRYHHEDPDGLKCPVGAHVRRTNPRDSLLPKPGSSESLDVNKRHRILRRGRTYGPPLATSLEPADFLRESEALRQNGGTQSDASRGLLFLCLNANIGRQFEFVQNMWVNNPNFGGLYTEPDPLIGRRRAGADSFSIPAEPVRQTVHVLPSFVDVVGGAYFFVPGVRALRFVSRTPKPLANRYSAPAPAAGPTRTSYSVLFMQIATRALQGGMSAFRRQPFAMLRDGVDAIFRPLVITGAQYFINRRRQDEGLGIGEEQLLPREDELARRITSSMTHFLYKHYRGPAGVAERAGNTKTYGLLRARFVVDKDIAEEHAVGVFQPGAEYTAYVRFGGPGPLVTPDIRNNGILSIGVKLMGVEGSKLSDDEKYTQDFSGISAPTFTTPNAIENLKLQKHIYQETEAFYFINPFDSHYMDALMQGVYSKSHGSPLDLRYWSCVPYSFGEGRAFQYTFVPGPHPRSKVPWMPSNDYLREAMIALLDEQDVEFDVKIQLQTDPHRMPIENASVIWPEQLSPWITVAKLHIPAQQFDIATQHAFARQISVNPWHCVAAHRPLGNQNRARKHVYLETSKVRQHINAEPRVEPTGDEEFD